MLHNEGLRNLLCPPNISKVTKARRLSWMLCVCKIKSERMERTLALRENIICVCMPQMYLGRTMSTPVENNHLVEEIIFPGSRVTNSELSRYMSILYCVETMSASFFHFYFLGLLLFVSFRHIPSSTSFL